MWLKRSTWSKVVPDSNLSQLMFDYRTIISSLSKYYKVDDAYKPSFRGWKINGAVFDS